MPMTKGDMHTEKYQSASSKVGKLAISTEKNNESILLEDERYSTIVSVIYRELIKRNIDLHECNTPEFSKKVQEIIELILQSSLFKKFKNDSVINIENALKRRLNYMHHSQKSEKKGPEL